MPKAEPTRVTAVLVWIAGFALIAGIIYGIRVLTRESIVVRTAQPAYANLSSSISTNGKVEPVAPFQAHAPLAGVVEKLYVRVGQKVQAGDMLVRMDDTDARARLATANASLSSARAALSTLDLGGTPESRNRAAADIASARLERQQAASNLATVQTLQGKGAASAGEVATAQQRLSSAELALSTATQRAGIHADAADRSSAQARVADAQAGVAAAESSYAGVAIRAPLAGEVYYIPVTQYDFVPAGDELMDVADLHRIQVRAYFDEPEIGRLAEGQAVRIVWDAKPASAWHGHIERAPTTVITYGTRNVGECIITVDDANGDLLPNTNVTVTVTEMQRPHALSLPREALHTEGTRSFVYRVLGKKLARTEVKVGVVNLTSVEIVSGVGPEDVVALGSTQSGKELSDGMEVKLKR